MKYKVENVTTKEQLQKLYSSSAFTMECLAPESIPDLMEWLSANTTFTTDEPTIYITRGHVMNEQYGLTGNNAYPKHVNIVSVIDIDQMKVAIPRFSIGARWFDDIVDNNAHRES